ncbi:hypothetical protein NHX12_014037 [Muraenolepis orangiensis]|uniref:Uncharacterized protein n=1 Tax=Muraenolepis orangiensis TaxID=630683 RepID=A0A9Q0DCU9_9TELE|nr:hypothetical protein NHX12_014037 [Muraenolepis orangiensis]
MVENRSRWRFLVENTSGGDSWWRTLQVEVLGGEPVRWRFLVEVTVGVFGPCGSTAMHPVSLKGPGLSLKAPGHAPVGPSPAGSRVSGVIQRDQECVRSDKEGPGECQE